VAANLYDKHKPATDGHAERRAIGKRWTTDRYLCASGRAHGPQFRTGDDRAGGEGPVLFSSRHSVEQSDGRQTLGAAVIEKTI
jgi:hypothetical protein